MDIRILVEEENDMPIKSQVGKGSVLVYGAVVDFEESS